MVDEKKLTRLKIFFKKLEINFLEKSRERWNKLLQVEKTMSTKIVVRVKIDSEKIVSRS